MLRGPGTGGYARDSDPGDEHATHQMTTCDVICGRSGSLIDKHIFVQARVVRVGVEHQATTTFGVQSHSPEAVILRARWDERDRSRRTDLHDQK